jgi:hypothetical protein
MLQPRHFLTFNIKKVIEFQSLWRHYHLTRQALELTAGSTEVMSIFFLEL